MFDQSIAPEISRYVPDILETQVQTLARALLALPVAAALGAALAFRPRRRGTPPRSAPVIQTQIILAVVGALVMMIVGASLARAFGIVGAANLIRYRAKIEDPKDAVVMLTTLSVGLATGVELYGLALFGTVFILAVLWVIESLEPERRKTFDLKVSAPDPATIRTHVENVLRRYDIKYELRSAGTKDLVYETNLPFETRTDRVSNAILLIDADGEKEVVWEEKKKK
jgi:uncharacterized membrane protein YhiD involved in acid resistance